MFIPLVENIVTTRSRQFEDSLPSPAQNFISDGLPQEVRDKLIRLITNYQSNEQTMDAILETARFGNAQYTGYIGIGSQYKTLLHLACEYGKNELARHLLEEGADVNAPSWFYATPHSPPTSGGTPLSWACSSYMYTLDIERRLELVDMLAAHGADMNAPSGEYGSSPLEEACMEASIDPDYEKMALRIIERGADISSEGRAGNGKYSLLSLPVSRGCTEVVRKICEAGYDVNFAGEGSAPLLLVSPNTAKAVDMARILLDYGADPNITCSEQTLADYPGDAGKTPLTSLCEREFDSYDSEKEFARYKELMELLLQRGADVNKGTGKGITALMYMCNHLVPENTLDEQALDIARLLLKYGANPAQHDQEGKTACDYLKTTDKALLDKIFQSLPELAPVKK